MKEFLYVIDGLIRLFISDGLGNFYDGDLYVITFFLDKGIYLGCSDECCSDGNIEFLFKWFWDGINGGICWCVAGCSVTVYDWYK